MESEKQRTENEEQACDEASAARRAPSARSICPACGAQAQRGNAQFCLVCGKLLREDYQPLDRLRASYNLQGKPLISAK